QVVLQPVDANDRNVAQALTEVNITLDDAKQLAADGQELLRAFDEREARDAAARAATTVLKASTSHLTDQLKGFGNIIKGELGTKSPALELFGLKVATPRGGTRKKNGSGSKSGSASGAGTSGSGSSASGSDASSTGTVTPNNSSGSSKS
ncbi:MAG: hypothetical protein JST54_27055, partial [Deltaproteobacteria bacterium]|nr:hypothetical protein [Deltaproteobacteria bacterium]